MHMYTKTVAPTMDWSDYLRAAMDARNVNGAELSRAIGVDQSTVSRWLNRQTKPEAEQLRSMSATLHIPLGDLLVASGWVSAEDLGIPPPDAPQPASQLYADIIQELDGAPEEIVEALRAVLRACRAVRNRLDPDADTEPLGG